MRKLLLTSLVALSGVLLFVACAERPQQPNWRVDLRLVPEAPQPMEETTFAVRLQAPTGEMVTGASVEFDLSMLGHQMGENRFRARETEAGLYTGQGRFAMPGDWQVQLRIEKGRQRQFALFHFQIQ